MGHADYLKLGDYNGICDQCGFKYKFSDLKKQWDDLIVCRKCFEHRHPQDFVRGVKDNQSVPESRSDSTPIFTEVAISLPLPGGN